MAFTYGNGGGGQWRSSRRLGMGGTPSISEINVVPLVDVVLVLLIIFMITANVMEFGLDIQVPRVRQVRDTNQPLPVVSITRTGELFLNEKPVNINLLAAAIHDRFHDASAVYVRADKETTWDPIAQVVSQLGEARFEVKMVTAPIDNAGRRR